MKRYWIALALFLAGLAIYGLDRGIYVGSATTSSASRYSVGQGVNAEEHTYTVVSKYCRYLFITGVVELPAPGGLGSAGMPGQRFDSDPDTLHCRIFSK